MPKGKPNAKKQVASKMPKSLDHYAPFGAHEDHKSPQQLMEISRATDGWLTDEESDGLWNAAQMAYSPNGNQWAIIGAYCGKSDILLAGTFANPPLNSIGAKNVLYSIDPHAGHLTSFSGWDENHMLISEGHVQNEPTYDKLVRNLAQAGLTEFVTICQVRSVEFIAPTPLNLLVIDGLHDYANVKADWEHFKQFLAPDAWVLWHDIGDWADPTRVFDEAVAAGEISFSFKHGSLAVSKFLGAK